MSGTLRVMQARMFYLAIVGFTLGIFIRSFFVLGLPFVVWGIVTAVGVMVVGRRKNSVFSTPYLLLFSVFLIAVSLGLLRMEIATYSEVNQIYESQRGEKVTLEGTIVREPDIRESSQHLYVQVADELLLVTTDRYTGIQYGDKISFTGKIEKPKSFETDQGRTFNYVGYLQARGVHYIVSFAKVQVTAQDQGNLVLALLLKGKHAFMSNLEAVLGEPYVGLSEGLLLGVSEGLGKKLEDAFRKTGVIHIVVLSGYNIMLVVLFVMYILARVLPMRFRLPFGVTTILLFACMVGLSPTVIRASAMALLLLLAQATGRTYAVVRALIITGVLMLVFNPYLLVYDVGFQFSFVATLGLILVSPYLASYVTFMPKRFGLREFLTATLATQIFITPILLYQMGQFSVVALVVNMLVLPMVPVAMLLTFLTGVVGFISISVSSLIGYTAYLSLAYIIVIVQRFAELPFASFGVPIFPFYVVVGVYGVYVYILRRLYLRSIKHSTVAVDSLEGWTVIDEASYVQNQKVTKFSVVPPITQQADNDTPVFFR